MNDQQTGPDPSGIDSAMEARVVAWVLGESSDFEKEELQRLVKRWPEMRVLKSRLEAVHELLEEMLAPQEMAGWRLSADLRDKLLKAMEFFSEGGSQGREILAFPIAQEVIAPAGKEEWEWGSGPAKWRVPWRKIAAVCAFFGILMTVVFSPTIFEEDSFVAAKFANPEERPSDFTSGFLGESLEKQVAAPENFDHQEGIRSRLEALDATMESFGAPEEDGERFEIDGREVVAPLPEGGTSKNERAPRGKELAVAGAKAETLREALETELLLVDSQLEKLKEVAEERRFEAVDKALQSQDYLEAKQDYESAKAMLRRMKLVNSSKRIALKIPRSPITIHEPATKPVKKGGTIFGGGRYESQAVVQTNPAVLETDPLAGATGPTSTGAYPTRSYILNDVGRVTQEATLREVANRLNLAGRWGTSGEAALKELRESVSAEQIRGTDLLGVKVRVKEKDDAAAIAAELVTVYKERREHEERERAVAALNALDAEVRMQEDLVEEKRKEFQTIGKATGIPYIEGMQGSGIMGQSEEGIVRVAQMQQFEREKKKRKLEIQVKTLGRLQGEELEKYVADLESSLPDVGAIPVRSAPRPPRDYVSTFSLHVSDVSFKLARAALQRGEWPKPETIRVEEFVNAFDYGGLPPSMSERVGANVAQAVHPFMQQRNLLRISVRTAAQGRSEGTSLRLTVLLDNSGSMERRDRAEAVRRAFALLATQLGEGDRVTLISFARTPRLLADRVKGNEVGELVELIENTQPGGGTNLEEALRLGYAKASEQWEEGAQNRVILLTDGAANLGNADPEDLSRVVAEMKSSRIAFDACGVGAEGLNDSILEALTRRGDGRYYLLDGPEDADEGFVQQIAGALRPAAENMKVQVRFNPKRVGRYQLYGFEQHELAEKDFRDDGVDAAELAAEEAGTALYQFEPLPEGTGPVGTVAVRFRDTASGGMVEKSWVIPYRRQVPRLAEAGPELRATVCAALLGERLRGSQLGDPVKMEELDRLVKGLTASYPLSEPVLALMGMTAKVREMERKGLE